MSKKQKIIINVVAILIITLTLIGITYAYFLTQIQGNTNTKSIEVSTADFRLKYDDGTDGIIFKENIIPGTEIGTKTFSVTNTGKTKIDNYGVYLEELINDFKYTSDVVYTLSCNSSITSKECNGNIETIFPTTNELLVTNEIEPQEIQTFTIHVLYKESGTDQSEDMNKTLRAKIQIYDLNNSVDITGKVTGAQLGDYVEMHSDTMKTSQIDSEGKYKIVGVDNGNHTIYIKSSKGLEKGKKDFSIQNDSEASINGNIINISKEIECIKMDITNISSTLTTTTSLGDNPYTSNKNSLAYNIINNSIKNKNGTKYLPVPLTKVAEEVSLYKYSQVLDTYGSYTMGISTSNQEYYWTYGTGYTVDEDTGKISLTGVNTCKYSDSDCPNKLLNNYVVGENASSNSSSTNVKKNTDDLTYIYKVTAAPATSSSSITSTLLTYKSVSYSAEKELSIAEDDYGTSYYFRGGVQDNYLNYNGMCWRIVRVEGDGSVELILANKYSECDLYSPTSTSGTIGDGYFGYSEQPITNTSGQTTTKNIVVSDFVNGITNVSSSIKYKLDTFLNSISNENKGKIKNKSWCLGNKTQLYDNTGTLISDQRNNLIYKGTAYYYSSAKRLYGKGEMPNASLKCDGDEFESKIGTLTADEVMFAGGTAKDYNLSYYLVDNANRWWWTLSTYRFTGSYDEVILFYTYQGYLTSSHPGNTNNFRPVVSLIPGIEITSGDGTPTNAYKLAD